MIKLNCGVSRKVGEPNYGSRGASVNLELELESQAAQDTEQLQGKIRRLFAMAKKAVDEELGTRPPAQGTGPAADSGNGAPTNGAPRPITDKQAAAIRSICERIGRDPEQEATKAFGRGLQQLTLPEASRLIDSLKSPTC